MRRFLWVLGATLILALLPLTGHVAFAAERPQTAVTGASATTDTHAEATTDPAVAVRSDHADRHDASDSTETADAAPASDDTGDARASRHTADGSDDGGTTANGTEHTDRHQDQSDGDQSDQAGPPPVASDQGDQGNAPANDPVAAPVVDAGTDPVAQLNPRTSSDHGQVSEPAAPGATESGHGPVVSVAVATARAESQALTVQGHESESGVAARASDRGGAEEPAGTTATESTDRASVAAPHTAIPARTEADNLATAPALSGLTILPPVQHDLDRLIAHLTVQGLCVPSGTEVGDLSCGGGAIQLCLRATATGISLSCATPGGAVPGGSSNPGTSGPPPVTRPSGNLPGSAQPGSSQSGGASDPGTGVPPVAAVPVTGPGDLGVSPDASDDLGTIGQVASGSGSDSTNPVVISRPVSFAPTGTVLSQPVAASVAVNIAALAHAPVTSAGPSLIGLRVTRNLPGLASLVRPGNAFLTQFGPKLSVLSLIDHAPPQPQLPELVARRLSMSDPFAGIPAVTARAAAGRPAPQAIAGGAKPVAVTAPSTAVRAAAAPAPQSGQQATASRVLLPFVPSGLGLLPAVEVPSPVTPLRLLLVLLASGCFVAAVMTKRKGPRPRPRAAPAAKRPSRLI